MIGSSDKSRVRAAGGLALILAISLGLPGCGSDGGSPSPTPTAANLPPTFASTGFSATQAENSNAALFTAQATDPEGRALNYSLAGADSGAFDITASGTVSFASPPNFDLPIDADRDNIYEFTIRASDGSGTTSADAQVTVTNDREGIVVRRIATGIDRPVGMDLGPQDGSIVVAEADGTLWDISGARQNVLTEVPLSADSELIDIGFGRTANDTWYIGTIVMVRSPAGISLLRPNRNCSGYQLAAGAPEGAVGAVGFHPNGGLFAIVGDPAGDRAQGDSGYGRIFAEVDPYGGASGCGIPMRAIGRGVRQPGGLAPFNEAMLFGDRGASEAHEINAFVPYRAGDTVTPKNFGWPFFEGTVRVRDGGPASLFQPTVVYPFGDGFMAGKGIILGGLYRGPVASLQGTFIFGDETGAIWTVPYTDVVNETVEGYGSRENRREDFSPDQGSIDRIVEIKTDSIGNVWILDADGEVFRLSF